MKSKKVEQGDYTREALLSAARQLFSQCGFANTSLDQIAQRAGVTKGALYHHFTSKDQLFRLVFETVKKELSQRAFPIEVADDNVWQDLVARCRLYIEAHTEPEVLRIALLDARSVLKWDEWQSVESEHGIVMLRGALRRAMHRRMIDIDPQSLSSLAMLLAGALMQACMLVANADDRGGAIDDAVRLIERLLEGLRPRA